MVTCSQRLPCQAHYQAPMPYMAQLMACCLSPLVLGRLRAMRRAG